VQSSSSGLWYSLCQPTGGENICNATDEFLSCLNCIDIYRFIGQDLIEQAKIYGGAYAVSCSKYSLTEDQERQCRDPGNRDFVISMGQGVNVVAYYCNSTFKNRKWNCPYVGGTHPFTQIAYQGQSNTVSRQTLLV
jgi:hypothetical protein